MDRTDGPFSLICDEHLSIPAARGVEGLRRSSPFVFSPEECNSARGSSPIRSPNVGKHPLGSGSSVSSQTAGRIQHLHLVPSWRWRSLERHGRTSSWKRSSLGGWGWSFSWSSHAVLEARSDWSFSQCCFVRRPFLDYPPSSDWSAWTCQHESAPDVRFPSLGSYLHADLANHHHPLPEDSLLLFPRRHRRRGWWSAGLHLENSLNQWPELVQMDRSHPERWRPCHL